MKSFLFCALTAFLVVFSTAVPVTVLQDFPAGAKGGKGHSDDDDGGRREGRGGDDRYERGRQRSGARERLSEHRRERCVERIEVFGEAREDAAALRDEEKGESRAQDSTQSIGMHRTRRSKGKDGPQPRLHPEKEIGE